MHLYILRHGIAFESHEWNGDDSSRPLTPEGIEKTTAIIETLKAEDKLHTDAIWSSPLKRAEETAQIAATILKLKVRIVDALACGATLKKLMKQLEPLPERLMFVGHEPDCGELIGQLTGDLVGDYALKKAGIAHLKGEFKPGGMKLVWKLAPKDILK